MTRRMKGRVDMTGTKPMRPKRLTRNKSSPTRKQMTTIMVETHTTLR